MNAHDEPFVPLALVRRGVRRIPAAGPASPDTAFLVGLGRACYWQHLLDTGAKASGSEIAHAEGLHPSTVNELLRLTLFAPAIIEQLLAGRQPPRMTLMWFQRHPLPADWLEQQQIMVQIDGEA